MAENARGVQILEGSLWKNIPKFALPVAATGILEQLFNAADIAVVGRFTGDQGTVNMAAVGANSPIVGLILNLFIGLALGANVVIANAIGQRNRERVTEAVHTSILFSFLAGFGVMIVGELIAAPLMESLNVPDEVLPQAILYLRVYLAGMPVILLYNFESAIYRSIGETRIPLIALAMSGIMNVFLNLLFVIGFHMTVNGVATATVISNLSSSLLLFIMLTRTDLPIRVTPRNIRIHRRVLRRILRIGLPAGIQSAVFSIANILIQSAINSLGTTIIAASSAAFNIEVVCYDVLNSFSQACTTFTGQCYGAADTDRCKKVLRTSVAEGAIATLLSCAIVLAFGRNLVGIFNTNPQVISMGVLRLRYIFSGYIFSMLYEVMSGYMRGYGISLRTAVATTIGVCGTRFFWIYAIFPRSRTFATIMTVYPLSLAVTAGIIFILLLVSRPSVRMSVQNG